MEEPKNTTERKKVVNVARPDDKKPNDSGSKLAKQAEIQTKIIEDNLGYESKASANKPNETDKKDAKEIKGGKTEIELNPKTDDKVGDESDETQKSKNAKNKANKEIGAKGAGEKIVKETNMDIKFGLSDSLIEAARKVMEAKMKGVCPKCGKNPCQCAGDPKEVDEGKLDEKLVGKQHKIDANHNGKIDGQDFKILRGKKKVEEEVETVDEAVNHREFGSKGKMHPTMAKGMKVGQHADFYGHGNGDKHYGMVTKNTGTAVHIKAAGKTHKFSVSHNVSEEVETVEEGNAANKEKKNAAVAAVGAKNKDSQYLNKMNPAVADKIRGREKMSGVDRKQYKEEVEQIDELSRKTLGSYAQKADKQLTTVNAVGPSHKAGIPGHYRGKNKDLGKDPTDKMRGRKAGINMAVKKLNKEEVEFSEAELARIEEIAKGL
jgi:hypothetical protein